MPVDQDYIEQMLLLFSSPLLHISLVLPYTNRALDEPSTKIILKRPLKVLPL
jgi:hypothetical protein